MSIRSGTTGGRGFNIVDFKSYISSAGVLSNHDFLAIIPWPAGMLQNQTLVQTERNLEFACDSINFPTTGVEVYTLQRYSYGAVETKPTIPKFSPLQCTFYCDSASNVQRFFHEWIKTIANYDFANGSIRTATGTIGGAQATPYEIGYKVDYAVDLHLQMYDLHGTMVKEIRFREAYPVQVGDVVFSWSRQNEIVKIPVALTFFDWSDVTTTAPTAA